MPEKLDDADRLYLELAVELSRGYRDDQRRWPFGAIVVVDGAGLASHPGRRGWGRAWPPDSPADVPGDLGGFWCLAGGTQTGQQVRLTV